MSLLAVLSALSASLVSPTASAGQERPLLTTPAPRAGREQVLVALHGEPRPADLARLWRAVGTAQWTPERFEAELEEAGATLRFLPRDFGLEVALDGPSGSLAALVPLVAELLVAPAFEPERLAPLGLAQLLAQVPSELDPLEHFEGRLLGLLYPSVTPDPWLEVDLAALFAGEGEAGAGEASAEGDAKGERSLSLPVPEAADLARRHLALRSGPAAGLVAADEPEPLLAPVRELLARLGPIDSGAAAGASISPPPAAALRSYGIAGHPDLPTMVGWIAPLDPALDICLPEVHQCLRSFADGPLTVALAPHLEPGTVPHVHLAHEGTGLPSLRITAQVQADSARAAQVALETALAGAGRFEPEAWSSGPAEDWAGLLSPLAPRSLGVAHAALGSGPPSPSASAAEFGRAALAAMTTARWRSLLMAPQEQLGDLWRLDRSAREQSSAAGLALVERLLARVGGAQRWGATRTVQYRTATPLADGQSGPSTLQWRDLTADRFALESQGATTNRVLLDGERATTRVDQGPVTAFPPLVHGLMQRAHLTSLVVTLHQLGAGDDSLRATVTDAGALQLEDLVGSRGRWTLDEQGWIRSAQLEDRSFAYADWSEVEGRWLPTSIENSHPPSRSVWSEFRFDVPPPDWFAAP
jgi:hypothetical protein